MSKKLIKREFPTIILVALLKIVKVIDKGFISEAFLFKPLGGLRPPRGLNRKPRKNPLFSL